jgi:adenylate cyclase class IV
MFYVESEVKLDITNLPQNLSNNELKQMLESCGFSITDVSTEWPKCRDYYYTNTINDVLRIRNHLGSGVKEVTVKKLIPGQPLSRYEVEFETHDESVFPFFEALGYRRQMTFYKENVVVFRATKGETKYHIGFYTVSAEYHNMTTPLYKLDFAEVEIDKADMSRFSYEYSDSLLNMAKQDLLRLMPEAQVEPRSLYTIFSGKNYKFITE